MLLQLALIQIVTFVGLIFILRFLFYNHLNSALRRLRDLNEKALMKEAALREELEKAKAERIAEVEKGRQEAKSIVEAAKKETESILARAEEQARENSRKAVLHGKEELDKLRQSMESQTAEKAIALATEMIRYAFSGDGRSSLQRQIIKEITGEIEGLDEEKFSVGTGSVRISSSCPLEDEERARLKDLLSRKMKTDVEINEDVNPELITGIVIQTGDLVIDASLRNKLRKVIPFLKNGPGK
ncbi:MAG: F0F1 ATP synthase subunit delta [Candidatus Omnitrophota bacterium]|jgi:F0F1-type ATP synthase delta subunit